MSFEICASGFDANVNGTYSMIATDIWSNGTYYIYHDSYYWYISDSQYTWEITHRVARRTYEVATDYTRVYGNGAYGDYTGLDGHSSGRIADGSCP